MVSKFNIKVYYACVPKRNVRIEQHYVTAMFLPWSNTRKNMLKLQMHWTRNTKCLRETAINGKDIPYL